LADGDLLRTGVPRTAAARNTCRDERRSRHDRSHGQRSRRSWVSAPGVVRRLARRFSDTAAQAARRTDRSRRHRARYRRRATHHPHALGPFRLARPATSLAGAVARREGEHRRLVLGSCGLRPRATREYEPALSKSAAEVSLISRAHGDRYPRPARAAPSGQGCCLIEHEGWATRLDAGRLGLRRRARTATTCPDRAGLSWGKRHTTNAALTATSTARTT